MIIFAFFFINFLINSCFCRVWEKQVIDEYVRAVRKCWERPAITIGIVELDENDQIKQSYTHSYGRIDPTCNSRCAQVNLFAYYFIFQQMKFSNVLKKII